MKIDDNEYVIEASERVNQTNTNTSNYNESIRNIENLDNYVDSSSKGSVEKVK